MQLSISGHHLDITDAINSYVGSKFDKLDRHNKFITKAHVILSVEKLEQKAEADIHVAGGNIHADAIDENLYTAIDKMINKLDRQLIKHKEKHRNH